MLTGIPFVDDHGALRPGQLLEVCGVGGSGKTEIFMRAAVNCVMPRERRGVRFGGCESSVLLLDLDGKFDTLRFLKILTARVKDAIARAAAEKDPREPPTRTPTPRSPTTRTPNPLEDSQTLRCHSSLDFLKALHVVERAFERREAKNAAAEMAEEKEKEKGNAAGGGAGPGTSPERVRERRERRGCRERPTRRRLSRLVGFCWWITSPRFTGWIVRRGGNRARLCRCTRCTTRPRRNCSN